MNLTIKNLSAYKRAMYFQECENYELFFNINCSIYEGEMLMILSKSWVRRFTLINAISHSSRPYFSTSGTILCNNVTLSAEQIIKYIGLIETSTLCLVDSTVIELLYYYNEIGGNKFDLNELIDRLGLHSLRKRKVSEITYYKLQLVYLAKNIILGKKIIVLMDFFIKEETENDITMFFSCLQELIKQYKIILIFSCDKIVLSACDYMQNFIVILENGNSVCCSKANFSTLFTNQDLFDTRMSFAPLTIQHMEEKDIDIERISNVSIYPKFLLINLQRHLKVLFTHHNFFIIFAWIIYLIGFQKVSLPKIRHDINLLNVSAQNDNIVFFIKHKSDLLISRIEKIVDLFETCITIHACFFLVTFIYSRCFFEDVFDNCINLHTLYFTNFILYFLLAIVPNTFYFLYQFFNKQENLSRIEIYAFLVSPIVVFIELAFISCVHMLETTGTFSIILIIMNFISSQQINNIFRTFELLKLQILNYLSWGYIFIPIVHLENLLIHLSLKNFNNFMRKSLPKLNDDLFSSPQVFKYIYGLKKNYDFCLFLISTTLILFLIYLILTFKTIFVKRIYSFQ